MSAIGQHGGTINPYNVPSKRIMVHSYLHAHLRHITGVTRAAEHFIHFSGLDRLILNDLRKETKAC